MQASRISARRAGSGDLKQHDLERLLEKRWKRYRAAQRRRKVMSGALMVAIRAAGMTAIFLRRARLMRQPRKESVVVE